MDHVYTENSPTLDRELRFWLAFTRRLPKLRGAGWLGNLVAKWYNRKSRRAVIVDVGGIQAELDPGENVDAALLFFPHLYDYKEIAFLRQHLKAGDQFVDVGAHLGFYSLVAAQIVHVCGRVLAIEADPFIHTRLVRNIELNSFQHIETVNVGASNQVETLLLGLNTGGNRAGSSFLLKRPQFLEVPCLPLAEILHRSGMARVDGMKLDIEGFEYRVMKQYFSEVDTSLYPRFLIVEHIWRDSAEAGGNVVRLLEEVGYRSEGATAYNTLLVAPEALKAGGA